MLWSQSLELDGTYSTKTFQGGITYYIDINFN